MTAVREPAVIHLLVEALGDVMAHRDGTQRQVARGQPLGHRHEVRHGVPVVDREPVARPPEAGHDLVGDHEDVVLVAQGADALDVAVGRDQDPVRAHDRLEEDGRDRVRPLVHDHVLEALQALGDRPRLLLAPAVGVRIAHHTHDAGLVRPAPRIAGEGHRAQRGAVVGAIAGEDLRPAGVVTGELDRVLDGLGTAEGEEDLVHIARQDLGELLAEARPGLGRERRLDVLELERLGRDRIDDAAVAMADVHRHELAVEVDDPLAFGRVEVDPFGVVDGDWVDGALDRPREERVLARQADDLGARHRGVVFDGHGRLPLDDLYAPAIVADAGRSLTCGRTLRAGATTTIPPL